MGKEKMVRKQGRELGVGDRMVCKDGKVRVITTVGPGPFPAMLEVSFHDGTDDILAAVVEFDVITGGPPSRGRMKLVKKAFQ